VLEDRFKVHAAYIFKIDINALGKLAAYLGNDIIRFLIIKDSIYSGLVL
jgi:hypothetical protein